MHIVLLHQHYHNPDCASWAKHYSLIDHWARAHEVTLVAGDTWRHQRITTRYPWVPEGVRLIEISAPYANHMGTPRRLLSFAQFALRARAALRKIPAPDVIVGSSVPLSVGVVAARAARRQKVPWVFEIQDLWPEFPIQMGALPRLLHSPLRLVEQRLYHSAAHTVAFSPGMQAHVSRFVPQEKHSLIHNGTDLDLVAQSETAALDSLRTAHGLGGKRVLLYAGAFGRANAIPLMLETARTLAHRDDHAFVFMGDGFYRERVAQAAQTLPNVRLVPPQPHHAIFPWFRLAELSLVSFLPLPVLGTNSPSKFYDSLACGTPVLVTNEGWMRTFVETHGCGWYASSADAAAYTQTVARLLDHPEMLAEAGARARLLPERPELRPMFDRQLQAARYLEIFEQIVARTPQLQ